jgi:hypothetical protein
MTQTTVLLSQLEKKALVFAIGRVCMLLSTFAWLAVKRGKRGQVAVAAPAGGHCRPTPRACWCSAEHAGFMHRR